MTEKRFYLMNVEDPLHEYGRWCKPVLEDGETGEQYEDALEVMDLLNKFNYENEQLKTYKKKVAKAFKVAINETTLTKQTENSLRTISKILEVDLE